MRPRRIILMILLCLMTLGQTGYAQTASEPASNGQDATRQQYEADVRALLRHPHRLAGTPEGKAAADYVEQRLREIGIADIYRLEIPTRQLVVHRCELVDGDQVIPLLPMQSNLTIPPVTPAGGLQGRVIYAGDGHPRRYGDLEPAGAIVLLDYDSGAGWRYAFEMGAQAVIFLGQGDDVSPERKNISIPARLVRLYAPPESVEPLLALAERHRESFLAFRATRTIDQRGGRLEILIPDQDEPTMIPLNTALLIQRQVSAGRFDEAATLLIRSVDRLNAIDVEDEASRAAAYKVALEAVRSEQNFFQNRTTVFSHATWENTVSTSIVAMLPGTSPVMDAVRDQPEVMVISAHLDTHGTVPQRSPGARAAANVATLLEAAEHYRENRPRRHLLLAFLDNHAQMRQGARSLYTLLETETATLDEQAAQRAAEMAFVEKIIDSLTSEDWIAEFDPDETSLSAAEQEILIGRLKEQADFARADANQRLAEYRLEGAAKEQIEQLKETIARWDEIRRFTSRRYSGRSQRDEFIENFRAAADPTYIEEMRVGLLARMNQRRDELLVERELNRTRIALRRQLGRHWISLHATLYISDRGPRWGIVPTDSTNEDMTMLRPTYDSPGQYGGVMRAFRRVVEDGVDAPNLSPQTLDDPNAAMRFPAGPFVTDGAVAGTFSIFNIAILTGADARPREGQPGDQLDQLDLDKMHQFGREVIRVLGAAADSDALSLPRRSRTYALYFPASWSESASRPSGNFVGIQVTGGLREDRPADGATVALWNSSGGLWLPLNKRLPPSYLPFAVTGTDANGHFPLLAIPGASAGAPPEFTAIATLSDQYGQVRAITGGESIKQLTPGRFRVDLLPSRGFTIVYPFLSQTNASIAPFRVMGAIANVEYREQRALTDQFENIGFFYLSERILRGTENTPIKVFAQLGPVILGASDEHPLGTGFEVGQFTTPPPANVLTAFDIWRLNEERLDVLRSKGITSAAMERLHYQARDNMQQAMLNDDTLESRASLAASTSRSRRIYSPIRESMNDLVTAVVILLLLTIPFAFSLERLLICATTIYGRLGWFVIFFGITFALLYFLHPGFSVATTPIIILLAFIIILLSSLVSYILLRKFNTELKAIQGQSGQAHAAEISRMGTVIAAANMGMSTMRRRPLRTALTALTVILLTFTILCFASVANDPGVKRAYIGAFGSTADADLMMRQLDYSKVSPDVLIVLEGRFGNQIQLMQQRWITREGTAPPISITRPDDGRTLYINSVMGVDHEELERWPDLAAALDPQDSTATTWEQRLGSRGVFLPSIIQTELDLKPGDPVLVDGQQAIFAGVLRANEMQQLTHIDGEPALPVDFQDPSVVAIRQEQQNASPDEQSDIQRQFARLSPNQIAVAANDLVRQAGGDIHIVRAYLEPEASVEALAIDSAEILMMPVWMRGPQGNERLIFTRLIEVQAGDALAVPLILGGLIVFGTMLGSISDREKEIYTFSALGLAPAHVGLLFFAEAAVYAIVGGMGGQLLAQFVAVAASGLAQAGLITPPSLNFSSTNALFAIFVVMLTVMISAIYPALRASRSANPGLARSWKFPKPEGDDWSMKFPFTVSAYDITGVVSYLAEHFRAHDDAGLGQFASQQTTISRAEGSEHLILEAEVALAPFDLGVTQHFTLTATPSEIPGVDEVVIEAHRISGTQGDWMRTNRVFVQNLRKQFLLWRTLSSEAIEGYRIRTLEELGEMPDGDDAEDDLDQHDHGKEDDQ